MERSTGGPPGIVIYTYLAQWALCAFRVLRRDLVIVIAGLSKIRRGVPISIPKDLAFRFGRRSIVLPKETPRMGLIVKVTNLPSTYTKLVKSQLVLPDRSSGQPNEMRR